MIRETVTPSIHQVKIDTSGRILLPAALRQQLGVHEGDSVLVIHEENLVRIESAADALDEAQEYFASFVPPDVSLVDELLAERRQEAARE